jgi:uncharacterized membrane protein YfcA
MLTTYMSISEALLLIGAGVLAGICSSVASLASVISYPVLLALNLPPLSANVTNTVSLVFTGAGSVAGSRPELTGLGARVGRLAVFTGIGGAVGAVLLLAAPASVFEFAVPVLIGGASLLLLVQPKIRGLAPRAGGERNWRLCAELAAAAMYVGYFGAAGGVMLILVIGAMIDLPMVRLNAIKNGVSWAANGVAAVGFAIFGPVHWAFVPPLAAGFLIGGWTGPKLVRRLPGNVLRIIIAVAGIGLAVKLGISAYR